jgi:hypothetical protein
MKSAFNLEMDFTTDCFGIKCNFGKIVNFPDRCNWLDCIRFVCTHGCHRIRILDLRTNIPVDRVGTNGEAVKNILETLGVDQRPLKPRRPLRELQ